MPDDRTILVETFIDPSGEQSLAVLSPFGGRLHHALKLALSGVIRQRLGFSPACLHSNDGLLFRLPMHGRAAAGPLRRADTGICRAVDS